MPSRKSDPAALGVMGGSGFARLAGLTDSRRLTVRTPYGKPSAPLVLGKLSGRGVVFLARHGDGHVFAPHEINYRANLWALQAARVRNVVAIATVGGIRADLAPGTLVIPDQIIDYTWGRVSAFRAPGKGEVKHIDFTRPYCDPLRRRLIEAARAAGEAVLDGGTYAATQGPRLETAAEIDRLERDGADMVGMTGMPEASLARELGLCYAAIAVVVNHAAGRGGSAKGIRVEALHAVTRRSMERVHRILGQLARRHGG